MGATPSSGSDTTADPDALKVIRFAFAPDPVWDYLKDSGIREEMESAANIAILDSATWNEVGVYAGGNADIMSVGDFEVPTIEEEFGIPSVIFGKYNIDRSIIVASPEHPEYTTLADCAGGTVAVWDTLSSTTIWGMLAHHLHDLDFRVDGGDFELVVVDITNTGAQAASGDTDCAIVLPDFNIPILMEEQVNVLYDGATSADLYAELVEKPRSRGADDQHLPGPRGLVRRSSRRGRLLPLALGPGPAGMGCQQERDHRQLPPAFRRGR